MCPRSGGRRLSRTRFARDSLTALESLSPQVVHSAKNAIFSLGCVVTERSTIQSVGSLRYGADCYLKSSRNL